MFRIDFFYKENFPLDDQTSQAKWPSQLITGFVQVLDNLESPWNFIVAFSRTGKSWKKATGPGKFWKSVKLKLKNIKSMEGSKEN